VGNVADATAKAKFPNEIDDVPRATAMCSRLLWVHLSRTLLVLDMHGNAFQCARTGVWGRILRRHLRRDPAGPDWFSRVARAAPGTSGRSAVGSASATGTRPTAGATTQAPCCQDSVAICCFRSYPSQFAFFPFIPRAAASDFEHIKCTLEFDMLRDENAKYPRVL